IDSHAAESTALAASRGCRLIAAEGNTSQTKLGIVGLVDGIIDVDVLHDVDRAAMGVFRPERRAVSQSNFDHGCAVLLFILSWKLLRNMFSSTQLMNASFNHRYLVSVYGSFGSMT